MVTGSVYHSREPNKAAQFSSISSSVLLFVSRELGESRWSRGHFPEAIKLFHEFSTSAQLADFLTIAAYDAVVAQDSTRPSKL